MASLTLIVIVDGEETYSGIGLLLEKRGYRVIEAVNDARALETLRRERPDIIIMDTDMSPARGLVVARGLRERARLHETAIVVVTTHKLPPTEDDSPAVALNDYVVRQGDFERLKNLINGLNAKASSLVRLETGGK